MGLETDITLLRAIPLFAELPTEQLRLIAFSAVRLELAANQVLFREGTKAISGFVVLSGKVQLTIGEKAPRQVASVCQPGALIGEVALFVETRRPATAIAAVPSQVLEIERKVILRMLNEYPEAAVRMHAMLSGRLSSTVVELSRVRQMLAPVVERRPPR